MKRGIGCLLAVCLLLQLPPWLLRAQTKAEGKQYGTYVSAAKESSLEVQIASIVPIKGRLDMQVYLKSENGTELQKTISFENGLEEDQRETLFSNLSSGSYRLSVTAAGFETYSQEIQMEGMNYRVQIFTDLVEGYSYTEGARHPGLMRLGDVDGDGIIGDNDADLLIDAVDSKASSAASGGFYYDLNRDGNIDLTDVQCLARSYGQQADRSAFVQESIAMSSVGDTVSGSDTVSGADAGTYIADIFGGADKTVSLSPKLADSPISEANPIKLEVNLAEPVTMGAVTIKSPEQSGNAVKTGTVELVYIEGGREETLSVPIEEKVTRTARQSAFVNVAKAAERSASVKRASDGTLILDLGGQIAVKKVTIVITGTQNNTNLAEISRVEFLNDMEKRLPEPEMNIPEGVTVITGNKEFTVSWKPSVNVTSYEVEISRGDQKELVKTANTKVRIQSFGGNKLQNGETYTVRVQSANGQWRSGFGTSVQATPKVTGIPDAPENVSAAGGYCSIALSWKAMEDTDSYTVYYREEGGSEYAKVPGITANKYTLTGLKDDTQYQFYLTGSNDVGESKPSKEYTARTFNVTPARLPEYKLINTSGGEGVLSAHIVSVQQKTGEMIGSPLDGAAAVSALGVADNSYRSYFYKADWDDGAAYAGENKGIVLTLDNVYQIGMISFAQPMDNDTYTRAAVYYADEATGKEKPASGVSIVRRQGENGRSYFLIKLAQPVNTKQLRVCIGRPYSDNRTIYIAEMRLHAYDSLENDIMALYEDDLHLTLKSDVTEATIQALQERIDTKDAVSGEYHPDRELLQKELDNAAQILEQGSLANTVNINPNITAKKDGHLGFGGLNAWQPLGITAAADETLVVYVGHNTKKTGDSADLELIATQYHAESGAFMSKAYGLQVGRNEITIPQIHSLNVEKGGSVYVQYTGNNPNDRYGVKVSGGSSIPVLNLYNVPREEWQPLLVSYIEQLEAHVAVQEETHNSVHVSAAMTNYSYDKANCILGATEILLDQMMYSVSGEQILAGLGSGTPEEKAEKLGASLQAMNDMMTLFYHHKGLSADSGAGSKNQLPSRHLNIRYQRMFAGAFMYAGGNHIGIEWGSVPGLSNSVPVTSDNGKYLSGRYFGWGIAHEIGHCINQSAYAYAEVTNNYFAVLAQAKDTNDSVRFRYEDVYDKVTSGTVGKASNVFTQLGMYWQLHLAYDRGYNFKVYDTYREQLSQLFFARVDTYARDASAAPSNPANPVELNLSGANSDQKFMRLACAAAQKDLTEFFERWGWIADGETIRYAAQFEKETRALYYVSDDARAYVIENADKQAEYTVKDRNAVGEISAAVDANVQNQVKLTLSNTAPRSDAVLGYEIARIVTHGGVESHEVIGFTTEETFTDTVTDLNNRVITYEVTVVDKFLSRSVPKRLSPIKISHDGSIGKSDWEVTTNMTSVQDEQPEGTEQAPCAPALKSAVSKVIDNNQTTVYTGTVQGEEPQITLHMKKDTAVTALKYRSGVKDAITDYEIQISSDGTSWRTVASGTFRLNESGIATVYFTNGKDPWVCTYDASYVKLIAKGQQGKLISAAEVDVLGPTGDNVEFMTDGGTEAFGYLKEAYVYDEKTDGTIPAGSLVFIGTYKGNPAYNVVILYDGEGHIVGGVDGAGKLKAHQIILADVPEQGELGNTSDGTFIYWVEPNLGIGEPIAPDSVRAELYRVDNALDNSGQRLVSDSLPAELPEELPQITIKP